MSDVIATEVTETEQPKRGRGRPKKTTPSETLEVTRETRVPLGGFAGPLSLQNKDPNYFYYWEIDEAVNGTKIERRLQAGYTFCRPEEGLVVGETSVYKTTNVGSIIRVPAGSGNKYHYLMKLPQEWRDDDVNRKAERVKQTEQALKQPSQKEGYYGELTIN